MQSRGSAGLWQIHHVNPKYACKDEQKVLPFPPSQSIFLTMEERNADGRRALPSPHEAIRVLREGPVGRLVLDRAERRNALTLAMWQALPQAMATLAAEEDLRVIVMCGAGGHFSSGADITEFAELFSGPAAAEYERANLDAFRALAESPLPTVAMIEGFCLGGGLALALCCDIRLASEKAVFALPPARLGLAYPLHGIMRLLQAVSPAAARELLLTGRRVDTSWALRTGLVNDVRSPEQLETETLAMARDIAANAPLSIAHARAAIDAMTGSLQEREAERLHALARSCFDSEDYAEGIRAFRERRPPRFRGE